MKAVDLFVKHKMWSENIVKNMHGRILRKKKSGFGVLYIIVSSKIILVGAI